MIKTNHENHNTSGGQASKTPARRKPGAKSHSPVSGEGALSEKFAGFELSLVLSGGSALGAYHLGACEVLLGAGLNPLWLVGTSIGAITAAILAGNEPSERIERLRSFWTIAQQPDLAPMWGIPRPLRARYNNQHAWAALLMGRPGMFSRRFPGELSLLPGMPSDSAIMDHRPMAGTLNALIDFDRLNDGDMRVSVVTLDMESGEEVWFDNAEDRITAEHLLACTAMAPLFPPVNIGGRLLCDAGFANNLPIDRVFRDLPAKDQLCIAVDLFCAEHGQPHTLDETVARVQDLVFSGQASRSAAALLRERGLLRQLDAESPSSILAHLAYRPPGTQRALKALDFSQRSLGERVRQGSEDMERMLNRVREAPHDSPLCYIRQE
jgi:NTE family protein